VENVCLKCKHVFPRKEDLKKHQLQVHPTSIRNDLVDPLQTSPKKEKSRKSRSSDHDKNSLDYQVQSTHPSELFETFQSDSEQAAVRSTSPNAGTNDELLLSTTESTNSSNVKLEKKQTQNKSNINEHCLQCQIPFASQEDLKKHQDWLKCALCKFKTSTQSILIDHVHQQHSNQTIDEVIANYTCVICQGFIADNANQLSQHLRRQHSRSIERKCCYCDKRRSSTAATLRHIDTVHLDIRKFPCPVCHHRFTCPRDLRNHQDHVHQLNV